MKDKIKQARWWRYAAWTAPFVALAILIGEYFLGIETTSTAIAVVITFISVSVFWWWWAVDAIVFMVRKSLDLERNFYSLKDSIKELKDDVGNRKRGE